MKLGVQIDKVLWDRLAGMQPREGTKTLIRTFIYKVMLGDLNMGNKTRAKATNGYYKMMGELAGEELKHVFEKLLEGICDALSESAHTKEGLKEKWKHQYFDDLKSHIRLYLKQNPEAIHQVYANLQPAIKDR